MTRDIEGIIAASKIRIGKINASACGNIDGVISLSCGKSSACRIAAIFGIGDIATPCDPENIAFGGDASNIVDIDISCVGTAANINGMGSRASEIDGATIGNGDIPRSGDDHIDAPMIIAAGAENKPKIPTVGDDDIAISSRLGVHGSESAIGGIKEQITTVIDGERLLRFDEKSRATRSIDKNIALDTTHHQIDREITRHLTLIVASININAIAHTRGVDVATEVVQINGKTSLIGIIFGCFRVVTEVSEEDPSKINSSFAQIAPIAKRTGDGIATQTTAEA